MIHLILGALMFLAGLGLFSRSELARWFAIAIAQVGFITAFPLWTILIVALDVVVIFALAARWEESAND